MEQWYPVLNRKQRKLHGGGGLLIGLRFVAQQTVGVSVECHAFICCICCALFGGLGSDSFCKLYRCLQ